MAFKLVRCKGPHGLPLIEIPDGPLFNERLSPGEIREADFYDLFRWAKRGGAMRLFACPRKDVKKGRCKTGLRMLRVRHQKKNLKPILKECKDGRLYERRKNIINRILKDVGMTEKDVAGLAQDTPGRAAGRAIVVAAILSFVGILSLKFLFPNLLTRKA
ncbi:MAG: hypothetical protein GTO22_00855 [Gemmatimonadales bacterium]|nr:hypothetical protein [Gemmatimonadales bacterium]